MSPEQAQLVSSYMFIWNFILQLTLGFMLGYRLGAYD